MQFSLEDIFRFAEWSADRNPLHVDPVFARDTYFGQPIAHGVLSVLGALAPTPRIPGASLQRIDVEFRGAVVPDRRFDTAFAAEPQGFALSVSGSDGPVLHIRAFTGERPADRVEMDASWVGAAAPAARVRREPARRTVDDFVRGIEILGEYRTTAPPAGYLGSGVRASEAQVLALCSYVVGMEIPGLRSLFTRLTLDFNAPPEITPELRYRARTVRFDQHFRVLDTRIDVATPDGRPVAAGLLRSYVPLGPSATDLDELAACLGDAKERLADTVALVTGGSRGLGAEISAALALAGCRVYTTARSDAGSAAHVREALAGRGHFMAFLQGDAGDSTWCREAVARIRTSEGRLNLLVLNACSPPSVLKVTPDAADAYDAYVSDNFRLIRAPLAAALPELDARAGAVAFISSSFVEDIPAGFGHYVALKRAGEGLVQAARREWPRISTLVARPPRLQTTWNDTPTGVVGAIPPAQAALHVVSKLASLVGTQQTSVLSAFPAFERPSATTPSADALRDCPVRIVSSFTTDPLIPGLEFWMVELGIRPALEIAPYGQILQTLLDPASAFGARGGLNVVLLGVRDWLRELPPEQSGSIEFIRQYLPHAAKELDGALRSHRARAGAETLLLVCPSYGAASAAEAIVLRQTERDLVAGLNGIPGLHIVSVSDLHARYGVHEDDVYDALRDKLAHIPYRDAYYHVLATAIARHVNRRLGPVRKVVVVDCDNTLWGGVVGEVGAEGVEILPAHTALHDTLTKLTQSGMLICLCSKNEESDVWRVFESRPDLRLKRADIVAAMINWQPKSQNVRALAERLNLGIDSFIFIDDNPVECAEVRARCPEVLTLEWPLDGDRARRLLEHTWELDAVQVTKEDATRAQMYRDEFRRQELRAGASTFADFISNLGLEVEVSSLAADDLRRAAQLTMRTNQFNFTTRRREERDIQTLLTDGQYEVRTIRVRDRFGDYGLVGLLIAQHQGGTLVTDTFLLSCRVLGRGVEHRMASELGRMALERGATNVHMRVETTSRNTPARHFLEAISKIGTGRGYETALECDFSATDLAALQFSPAGATDVVEDDSEPATDAASSVSGRAIRRREALITRTAFEWSSPGGLAAAIDGGPPQRSVAAPRDPGDVSTVVYAAFASALRTTEARVKDVDGLEALGCDSLKIVEITVALLEKFPWLPSTLLFEHRSVSGLLDEVVRLASAEGQTADHPVASRQSAVPRTGEVAPSSGDVAVVGMHVRCAGVNSPDELWDLLSEGRSAVQPVPHDWKHFLHALADSRPHWAGLLDDASRFDAEFFGISPREAEFVDPQLRLFLEVAWSALEDAGAAGPEFDTDTGVFVGVMYGDYASGANMSAKESGSPYKCWEGFSLANRLSQLLGFRGPSIAVDTACSSSGTALHLATRALSAGDCRVAIVGGVNLILDPDRFGSLGRLGILSSRGACEPFGADADGTVLGEGAGAVVLRPLADAIRRGDRIYGVIKGTGLSTGSGAVGFTAPNPQAQAEAIRRALTSAHVDPRTVTYVETHGTGTLLGDPIEVRGLTLAYTAPDAMDPALNLDHKCRIGSIKPNIGHLEAGAGIVGLIKVLLQMQRGILLPSITSPRPNPHIPFAQTPFEVQRALEPWKRQATEVDGATTILPRRAGLSSFGVGGANAHVIVEESPLPVPRAAGSDRPTHVLTLSATSNEGLNRQITQMRNFLDAHPDVELADICFSANTGHKAFDHRAAFPADDRTGLQAQLTSALRGRPTSGASIAAIKADGKPTVAFLFTGQGSQYAGMGRQFYETHPVFRSAIDRCAAIFDAHLGQSLLDLLFAPDDSEPAALLNQTGFTQPALFAFEYALAQLWRSWGIEPDVVMGHSVGEIAAMCVSGGVSLDDGLRLIAARGRLMQALPPGGSMTSVIAPETRVLEALAGAEGRVAIAAINAPHQVVISGAGTAVAEIASKLEADGIKTKALTVSHAFHSPLMQPMLTEYQTVVRGVRFSPPRIPFVSCVDGALVSDEVTRPDYWVRQITDPVRFAAGMRVAEAREVDAYIEIGPHPVLLAMGRECAGDRAASVAWLPSLRRDSNPWHTILASLSRLYTLGAPVDWKAFDAPYTRSRVSIPAYAFDPKRYWLRFQTTTTIGGLAGVSGTSGGTVAAPVQATDADAMADLCYEVRWLPQPLASGSGATRASRRWVLLGHDNPTTRSLRAHLLQEGGTVSIVSPGTRFGKTGEHSFEIDPLRASDFVQVLESLQAPEGEPTAFVHLWSLDTPADDRLSRESLEEAQRLILGSAIHLLQAVVASRGAAALWFVTRGAMAVGTPEITSLSTAHAPLWGFGRTLALEHPDMWGGLIDMSLGEAEPAGAEIRAVVDEIRSASGEDQVAFRGGTRHVARLERSTRRASSFTVRTDATYLVTGGLGALGLRVASWLVSKGARHLVLMSRRGAIDPSRQAACDALRSAGATVSIMAADVASENDVNSVFAGIDPVAHPLRGVFHTAGLDTQVPLARLSLQDLADVLAAKVSGTWLLDRKTRDLELDAFVVFSSVAAVLGSQGRAHYAAANAFLDTIVVERGRMNLPAVGISWGPWKGGGMADDDQLRQFGRIGNRGLEPDVAVRALDAFAAGSGVCIAVADIDWATFRTAYEARRVRPLVSGLTTHQPTTAAARVAAAEGGAGWSRDLQALPPEARLARLTVLLRDEVADTLGFDRGEDVPLEKSFYDLGMDSLMMADLVGRLQKRLGFSASALAFDHPDVRALAPPLLDRLHSESGTIMSASPAPSGSAGPDRALTSDVDVVQVVPYDPVGKTAVVDFLKRAFPHRRQETLADRFDWMFLQSAARLQTRPHLWLARDHGRIVGITGGIPVVLKIGATDGTVDWFVETRVLEEFRTAAVGTRLMIAAQSDVSWALSLGQTDEMRQIQFRLGWAQIAPLQTAQLLIRPERVLQGKVPAAVAWAAGLGFRATNAIWRSPATHAAGDVREVARFGDVHDHLWRKMSEEMTCAVVRDSSYLNWKYVDQPGQDFLRLEVRDGGEVRAVAVCMFREPDDAYRYRRAFLVDLVVPPSDQRAVLQALRAVVTAAVESDADSITCLHVGGWLTRALRQQGFRMRAPGRFLLALATNLEQPVRERLLSEANWYVTQGDSDIDRPEPSRRADRAR